MNKKNIIYYDSYMAESNKNNIYERTFTYRTGMTCYEEGLVNGIYYSMGWLGSGYVPQQITEGRVPRMDYSRFAEGSAFVININGQDLVSHWDFLAYERVETEKGLLVKVKLSHQLVNINVTINTLLDGTPIITRWLEIENNTNEIALLSTLTILGGGLQITPRFRCFLDEGQSLYRVGYMECVNWGLEGSFKWHDLPNSGYSIKGKFGRDRFRHPMFVLENRGTGEHFICQLAYSGGWKFDFDLDEDIWAFSGSGNSNLSFKVSLDAFAPLIDLDKGEIIKSPEVHIGMMYGSFDDAINNMHEHVRSTVMTSQPNWDTPIECGLGPEMDMDEPALLRTIDYAEKHGLEYFIIDAGWFCPKDSKEGWYPYLGDWFPEKERYDMGIHNIRELCHSKGIKFGLWMEVERIMHLSKLFQEHKDYLANTYQTPIDSVISSPGPLALSKNEVRDWVKQQIDKLIEHYKLDLFRLDYNDFRRSYDVKGNILVNSELRYNINLYQIFDELRVKYPDVIFENCASGGGRTDLGMMKRSSHTWVTDWQHAPRSFAITNGMSMCLPPEYIDRLLGAQSGHIEGDFRFQSRLLLFGRPTINASTVCGYEENSIQSEMIDHVLNIYRTVVRPFAKNCKVYHHTPEHEYIEPKGVGILELAASDKTAAIAGIFNLSASKGNTDTLFYFKGLDISKNYKLTMDNMCRTVSISGYSLMNDGVRVRLGGALDSELLIVTEK